MTDGRLFLAIAGLICMGIFFNGLRFSRMNANPFAGRTLFGMPVQGRDMTPTGIRMLGRIQMIAAPIFLFFFTALCFGLFGPVDGISIIDLG